MTNISHNLSVLVDNRWKLFLNSTMHHSVKYTIRKETSCSLIDLYLALLQTWQALLDGFLGITYLFVFSEAHRHLSQSREPTRPQRMFVIASWKLFVAN